MQYFVKRGEQQFGPYTLDEMRLYVQKGNIGGDDMARSEAMEGWAPIGEVLGNIAPTASVQQQGFGDVSMPTDEDSPSRSNILKLHWGLLLVISLCTCLLFQLIWGFVICVWVRKLRQDNKALIYYSLYVLLAFLSGFLGTRVGDIKPLFSLAYIILAQAANFSVRSALEDYYNNEENIGLDLNGVATFFLSFYYFQYHLNRIYDWKTTGVLRPQS